MQKAILITVATLFIIVAGVAIVKYIHDSRYQEIKILNRTWSVSSSSVSISRDEDKIFAEDSNARIEVLPSENPIIYEPVGDLEVRNVSEGVFVIKTANSIFFADDVIDSCSYVWSEDSFESSGSQCFSIVLEDFGSRVTCVKGGLQECIDLFEQMELTGSPAVGSTQLYLQSAGVGFDFNGKLKVRTWSQSPEYSLAFDLKENSEEISVFKALADSPEAWISDQQNSGGVATKKEPKVVVLGKNSYLAGRFDIQGRDRDVYVLQVGVGEVLVIGAPSQPKNTEMTKLKETLLTSIFTSLN